MENNFMSEKRYFIKGNEFRRERQASFHLKILL